MFIFARSEIQKSIDAISARSLLSQKQLETLVARLNKPGIDRLAASWEIVFLDVMSIIGKVDYEVPMPKRTPDILFTYPGTNGGGFIADITLVSDSGLDVQNPIEDFTAELAHLARKNGVNANKLDIRCAMKTTGVTNKKKVVLSIPKRGEQRDVLEKHVVPFLRKIKTQNPKNDQVRVQVGDVDVTVGYNSQQLYMSAGYASYKRPMSLRQNPLWNSLNGKADQLREVKTTFPKGIIICDGGCEVLRPDYTYAPDTFKAEDIIREVFRSTQAIDFIVIVNVQRLGQSFDQRPDFRLNSRFFVSPRINHQSQISQLRQVFQTAIQKLPKPILDPVNAAIQCCESDYGWGNHGDYQIEGARRVKISSRILLELLADKITSERFHEIQGWSTKAEKAHTANPFAMRLSEGRMISGVTIEKRENENDEWVVFEFGPPNPAISPFTIRKP